MQGHVVIVDSEISRLGAAGGFEPPLAPIAPGIATPKPATDLLVDDLVATPTLVPERTLETPAPRLR